jgi:hypothetical protein
MSVIPFAEWRPDMPDLGQWAREAITWSVTTPMRC